MADLNVSNVLNSIKETAAANTAQSQAFAEKQMKFNAEQAALNRQWQENMSNTAHQREVKDLIAAGLNPVLSTGGSGAATPSGATAVGASGKVDSSYASALAGYVTSLVNSATQVRTAELSAQALLGSSAMSAAATRFASQTSAEASKYGSDRSALASMYGSSRSFVASILGSTMSAKSNKYAVDTDKYIKTNYPTTPYGAASSILNGISKIIFPGAHK